MCVTGGMLGEGDRNFEPQERAVDPRGEWGRGFSGTRRGVKRRDPENEVGLLFGAQG